MNFQVSLKYKYCCKTKSKKCHTIIAVVDSFFVYLCKFILYERCVNVKSCEPAAVLGFPVRVKVVERIQPESTAVGSLRNPTPHSPISPFSYLPIFPASLFTPSALLNKINNRSLFKNTQKRYGRGDLAPTWTKIIKTPSDLPST